MLNSFEEGFLIGILAGEGHFGGDGKQPQITLKMHVRHQKLFNWLIEKFPDSKLYGPYFHDKRHYYQWMARGNTLRSQILPIILSYFDFLDDHVKMRIRDMCKRYNLVPQPPLSID